jgi:hypothetical protein
MVGWCFVDRVSLPVAEVFIRYHGLDQGVSALWGYERDLTALLRSIRLAACLCVT